jgi:hypothetical protein
MCQTVGAELMARQEEGKLPFRIKHAILLNGSTLVDMDELAPIQIEFLKLPDRGPKVVFNDLSGDKNGNFKRTRPEIPQN